MFAGVVPSSHLRYFLKQQIKVRRCHSKPCPEPPIPHKSEITSNVHAIEQTPLLAEDRSSRTRTSSMLLACPL